STYIAICARWNAPMPRCTMPGLMLERSYGSRTAGQAADSRDALAFSVNFDERLDQPGLLIGPDRDRARRVAERRAMGDQSADRDVAAANGVDHPAEIVVRGIAAAEQ